MSQLELAVVGHWQIQVRAALVSAALKEVAKATAGLLLAWQLAGCAGLDTPSPARRLNVAGGKVPLKVAVVIAPRLAAATYGTLAKEEEWVSGGTWKWVDRPVTIRVGKSSVELIRNVVPRLYESVEFLASDPGSSAGFQLVLTLDLSRAEASHQLVEVPSLLCVGKDDGKDGKTLTTAATAQVTYEVMAKGVISPPLRFAETGFGRAEGSVLGCLASPPREALRNAFEAAQAEAFAALFRRLHTDTTFQAFVTREDEKRALPADLVVEARFDDSQGILPNNRLDAGEEAALVVRVTNQGRGSGYGVVLAASADHPQVFLPGPKDLGEVAPGASQEVRVPIKAGMEPPEASVNVLIEARERRGYDARKVRIVLATARLERPALSITTYEVNDGTSGLARGNGNGIPENGETIELLVFVKNAGPGPAPAVMLSLAAAGTGVEIVQGTAAFGTIGANQTVRGGVVFAIPRTYSGAALSLTLQVTDGRGAAVAGTVRQVALPVTSRAPVLATETRLLRSGQEVIELTNDQTVDIEVTPRNSGTLDAEQVRVRIRPAHPDVMLGRDQAEIGALGAGATGSPQRFAITIPRVFAQDRLAIAVELSERDFPTQTERLEITVRPRRPVLRPTFNVVGQRGGRAIEQNETANLEVRIVNAGDLPAENLEAKIDLTVPGLEVQGPRAVGIGTLQPNDQGVAVFKLRSSRALAPGAIQIPLTIAQAGFPPVTEMLRVQVESEREQTVSLGAAPPSLPAPSPGQRPVVVLINPSDGQTVQELQVELRATVVDDQGIDRVQVEVNGKPLPAATVSQGLRRRPRSTREMYDLVLPLPLDQGENTIVVRVLDRAKRDEEVAFKVTRLEGARPPNPYPNSWALVIGINAYQKTPQLNYAVADAKAVAAALPTLGFPPQNIRVLLDSDATKARIERALYQEFATIGPSDRLLVFFSGHGETLTIRGGQEGYLLPANADPSALPLTAIPMDDVKRIGQRLKARHVLFVFDACFSGFALTKDIAPQRTTDEVVEAALREPVVQVLTAGRKGEKAIEEGGNGLFTRRFLDALRGLADPEGRGVLTAAQLAAWIEPRVIRDSNGRMTPQYGKLDGEGQFLFVLPKP